jgi:UDP-galactopyranose mutase
MANPDVLAIGGGLSGLALAYKAARAGRRVLVLEAAPRIGGCFHSARRADGHWFEMGAHTCYNSYGGFLELAEAAGVVPRILVRGPQRARFGLLREGRYDWLTPPKILLRLGWLEAALHGPLGLVRGKRGRSMRRYFEGLVGPRNYARIFGPFFAAVPSQCADGFPAEGPGSLFKKRPRREDWPRSFGFDGGLQSVLDGLAALPGIRVETGAAVAALRRGPSGWVAATTDGRRFEAPLAALATPPDAAARLLGDALPEVAALAARVRTVAVDSMGVVLPRARCWLPEIAFLVPVDDVFHSVVTRDPFPDPARRAFVFHFKPGLPREARLARMAEVLRVDAAELTDVVEQHLVLPSPAVGHERLVADLDRALADVPLALSGNWFDGLAIEDCVQRSFAEWTRVAGLARAPRPAAHDRIAPATAAPG